MEVQEEFIKRRPLQGVTAIIWKAALFMIAVMGIMYILGIHQKLGFVVYQEQYIGFFLGLVLFSAFLVMPAVKKNVSSKVPWYDWILSILGLLAGFYMMLYYPQLITSTTNLPFERVFLSIVAILLLMEALRRVVGLILFTIVGFFIVYAFAAPYMPGALEGRQIGATQLFNYLYLDYNGFVGLLGIAATTALAFILFGQALLVFKGGDIINDFAINSFGRFRGGPAKASIAGSSLIGTVTGNPVSNVMLSGSVTIPLMKKHGLKGSQAGGIEAVASSGGGLLPPVMGVSAFIMAEFLSLPYTTVALAALVPAVLYYLCLFMQVDLIAARNGMGKMKKSEMIPWKKIFTTFWMVLPAFVFLIYSLFILGYTPPLAGVYSAAIALVFLLFQREVWKDILSRLLEVFVGTGKMLMEIGVILGGAGIVVGIMSITGLGFNLAYLLVQVGQYGVFYLLFAAAVMSIILGMGMPSMAAYTLVATLVAPSVVEFGYPALAAHLFVYYFASLATFTPPIAVCCFAAAPIAKASPNKIGIEAMKLGIVGYLVPFAFIFAPVMLIPIGLETSITNMIIKIIFAVIACIIISYGIVGFFVRKLSVWNRIIIIACSLAMFWPIDVFGQSLIINLIMLGIVAFILVKDWIQNRIDNQQVIEDVTVEATKTT
ncbi:TRAP transporter permease [Halalkalibacter alkaliphilus]|uniref:TRAP transporter fused permease subunit n=1 Tax=Halalkalibacter alkaliphilus TaxID=2917993 RepID=A0A9X2CVC9_9BACI|nr:TRAP transporter fused permease subunit [Halalkalibacter alkaliphilus]MCL7748544.1 TRAP transporter fused permease subunit [Halalkalibacter alkaliphilus]